MGTHFKNNVLGAAKVVIVVEGVGGQGRIIYTVCTELGWVGQADRSGGAPLALL